MTHKVVGAAIGTNSLAAVCANVCNLRCKGSARRLKAHTLFRFIAVPVARALEKIGVRRGEGRGEGEIKKKKRLGCRGQTQKQGGEGNAKDADIAHLVGACCICNSQNGKEKKGQHWGLPQKKHRREQGDFLLSGELDSRKRRTSATIQMTKRSNPQTHTHTHTHLERD